MLKTNEIFTEPSIFQFQSYRLYLKAILEANQKRSPKLNRRAFAILLEVSPHCLTQVLAGKQEFSSDLILQISEKLNLNTLEKEHLFAIHAAEVLTESVIDDPFGGVFHWRAIVLMEALYLKALEQDPKRIAKILRTTPTEIKTIIKKLVTLGVLKKAKNGIYEKSAFYFQLSVPEKEKSIRTFRLRMKKLTLRRILPDTFFL